jgi:hypothetical protein
MTAPSAADQTVGSRAADERFVTLGAGLTLAGFLFNLIVTMAWHPAGAEDDHPAIFADYAASDGWVLTHFGQFLGVVVALAGLYVLCQAFRVRPRADLLARLGMGVLIATAAGFAILQAVDGVTLKQGVDSWAAASGAEREVRFADAETVRWTEWGIQSYFRILLGLSLTLVGAALVTSRLLPSWLGWVAGLGGLLSLAVGIDVGYQGLESGFQDVVDLASQVVLAVFVIGVVVAAFRGKPSAPTRYSDSRS